MQSVRIIAKGIKKLATATEDIIALVEVVKEFGKSIKRR
jgi:hypothetical protein